MTCWSSHWASGMRRLTAQLLEPGSLVSNYSSTGMFPHNQLYKREDPVSSSAPGENVLLMLPPADRNSNNHSIKKPRRSCCDPHSWSWWVKSCGIRAAGGLEANIGHQEKKSLKCQQTEWVWLIWLLIITGVLAFSVSHSNQRSEHYNTNRTNTISSCNAKTQQLHNDLIMTGPLKQKPKSDLHFP